MLFPEINKTLTLKRLNICSYLSHFINFSLTYALAICLRDRFYFNSI